MSRRRLGIAIAAIGAVIALLAAAADAVGLSGSGSDGFGNRQIAGLVVGLLVIAAGVIVAVRGKDSS